MTDDRSARQGPTTVARLDYKSAGLRGVLPPLKPAEAQNGEAYVYIAAFGDIVKVGRSANPRDRVVQHRRTFASHGPLRRAWISGPHLDSRANELALINHCQQAGRLVPGTTEAFAGVPVEAVVKLAESLPFPRFDVQAHVQARSQAWDEYRKHLDETDVSLHLMDFHSPDFVLVRREAWNRQREESLPQLFGRFGDKYDIKKIAKTGLPDSLVMEMAEALADGDVEALMDMTFIDIIAHAARSKVALEAALLKTHALENDRQDLLRTVRDAWLAGVDGSSGGTA